MLGLKLKIYSKSVTLRNVKGRAKHGFKTLRLQRHRHSSPTPRRPPKSDATRKFQPVFSAFLENKATFRRFDSTEKSADDSCLTSDGDPAANGPETLETLPFSALTLRTRGSQFGSQVTTKNINRKKETDKTTMHGASCLACSVGRKHRAPVLRGRNGKLPARGWFVTGWFRRKSTTAIFSKL